VDCNFVSKPSRLPCELNGYCGQGLDHDGPCVEYPSLAKPSDAEKIARLTKALAFYADPRRYLGPNARNDWDDPYAKGVYPVYVQDVSRDGGDVARAALAECAP
jgi:hypothetical protein